MNRKFASIIAQTLQPNLAWVEELHWRRTLTLAVISFFGLALYGFTVGYWRSPVMGLYVAVKMPALIVCTLGCNALLNGLLGVLCNTGLGFRQSLMALLWAFAVAAILLGSVAPITFFLAWNAPSPQAGNAGVAHAAYLLAHTALIACAGIFSNIHLHRLLASKATNRSAATLTLFSWLAGNGLLGAQFSWILRPFFGSPTLDVAFLREHPFEGTFYESVWSSIQAITGGHGALWGALIAILSLIIGAKIFVDSKHQTTTSTTKSI